MATEPSGANIYSPKIADQALARKFVSQGGTGYVAISIQAGATPTDPDPDTLELAIWQRDTMVEPPPPANPHGTQVLTVTTSSITRDEVGKFHYNIGPELTADRGLLTAIWTYTVTPEGGEPAQFEFTDHLQVLEPMPVYDSCSDAEKSVVDQVTWMFADLYDSTEGGPHLIEEFQTHWGFERIAQLQRIAVQRMNFIGNYGNPPTNWAVGSSSASSSSSSSSTEITRPDGSTFIMYASSGSSRGGTEVPDAFSGLAVLGTYVEVLRHLRDSYTEIPNRPNMDVTYTDRRDYFSRWGATLQQEEAAWRQSVKDAKRSLLSMSRGSLLVAGGIYGGSALGIFQSGTYAAQVRSWRFYPAAPAIAWGATAH